MSKDKAVEVGDVYTHKIHSYTDSLETVKVISIRADWATYQIIHTDEPFMRLQPDDSFKADPLGRGCVHVSTLTGPGWFKGVPLHHTR